MLFYKLNYGVFGNGSYVLRICIFYRVYGNVIYRIDINMLIGC